MVSDASKREKIVRDAKRVSAVRVATYQPARTAVPRCYSPDGLVAAELISQAARLEGIVSPQEFENECNKLSAPALRRLAAMADRIDCPGERIVRPSQGFEHLLIENVRVSVQPEVAFSFAHKGIRKFGGVMVNFSKTESLARVSSKLAAGNYAAFLVFHMLGLRHGRDGGPRYANCFSVDLYRDEVYTAPGAQITMLKNIEAACRMIALQWDAISEKDDDSPENDFVF